MTESELKELLVSYPVCKRHLSAQKYAKEYFGAADVTPKSYYEARIALVESLIKLIEPSDKYTLLRLHYIEGLSIEKCAECIGVSRRTGYRLHDKAIKSLHCIIRRKEVLNYEPTQKDHLH